MQTRSKSTGLANYSNVVFRDNNRAPIKFPIYIIEYVSISVLPFLAAACNGAVDIAGYLLRLIGNVSSVLNFLLLGVHCQVHYIGVLEVIGRCSSDFVSLVFDSAWIYPTKS